MSKQTNELQKIKVMVTEEEAVYYGYALRSKMKTENSPLRYPRKKIGYDFKNGTYCHIEKTF